MTQIIPNLYQIPMDGTSAFLLVEDEITVIDAGWRGKGSRVLDFLRTLGRSPEEISYIISTHYHLDHIGGVAQLKDSSPGRAAIHESEIQYVERKSGEKLPNPAKNRLLGLLLSPVLSFYHPPSFSVDLPLQDGTRLHQLGGMEVIHTPGHTPGSISLHFPQQGLLIAGMPCNIKGTGWACPPAGSPPTWSRRRSRCGGWPGWTSTPSALATSWPSKAGRRESCGISPTRWSERPALLPAVPGYRAWRRWVE
ncbi:MAG: MBL fold metallo-hydrolase [Dehalococcoidia bacterium]